MDHAQSFRLPQTCLPRPDIDLSKWAVVACDQYTAEPAYWQAVARDVGDAPSSLHLIFPEVFLGAPDAPARIRQVQATMRRYLAEGVLRDHAGAILVERELGRRTRRGLMLELDLEHYDFGSGSTSLIRPTEGTIVERLAPRIQIRADAELELPHILVLIDDPDHTVLEPLAASRQAPAPLYAGELMWGGGHVAGYAVDDAPMQHALRALARLGDAQAFAQRHGVPVSTPPLLFAVGDGNHSLATAKSIWDRVKADVGPEHPSRYALVEVENIHDPALQFEPIHRLLFGVGVGVDVRQELARAFGDRLRWSAVDSAEAMRRLLRETPAWTQRAGLIGPGPRFAVIEIADPPSTLTVGTLQPFIDSLVQRGAVGEVDYIHGDDVLERLASSAGDLIGIQLPALDKRELLRMVVREGPLPRKTFSMGEAHEKRFYIEARRIRPVAAGL